MTNAVIFTLSAFHSPRVRTKLAPKDTCMFILNKFQSRNMAAEQMVALPVFSRNSFKCRLREGQRLLPTNRISWLIVTKRKGGEREGRWSDAFRDRIRTSGQRDKSGRRLRDWENRSILGATSHSPPPYLQNQTRSK